MRIKPFDYTDEAYATRVDLHRTLEPEDQMTVDLLRGDDQELAAENNVVRVLGEVDKQGIASGTYGQARSSGQECYQFSFTVHPDFQKGEVPG